MEKVEIFGYSIPVGKATAGEVRAFMEFSKAQREAIKEAAKRAGLRWWEVLGVSRDEQDDAVIEAAYRTTLEAMEAQRKSDKNPALDARIERVKEAYDLAAERNEAGKNFDLMLNIIANAITYRLRKKVSRDDLEYMEMPPMSELAAAFQAILGSLTATLTKAAQGAEEQEPKNAVGATQMTG